MVARKRGRDEMETEEPVEEPSSLQQLRNMWQFANLGQYISLFKGALKIDEDFGIEDLETECLMPQPSAKLAAIGLALLKHVSSHKGLTPEIFDEYTRRQFVAKAPARNPFGTEEVPHKFDDFDVFTKIRVLQQLSVWTLNNPNTIRERLNSTDAEQVLWRFDPFGYDAKGRTLFILDDMRMYRRTDPPPAPPPQKPKPKAKSRKSRSSRSSKRRKTSTPEPEEPEEDNEITEIPYEEPHDDGFGGMKWECVCITFEDYQDYMTDIRKSRNADEKELYKSIEADIIPGLAKVAEAQARKEARKMKELQTLQKLATAKRSSRISAKMEKKKEIDEIEEAERKRREEIAMAKAEQSKQRQMEDAHESRRQTREQRIREREAQKILQVENLRKLEEDKERLASEEARLSERHLTAQMKKAKRDLEKLKEKEYWLFDCEKCGLNGVCIDDGKPQIQCDEKDGCGVWQHSVCHNISAKRAEAEDFKFLCASCTRKQQAAKEPKLALKLRLTSASPSSQRTSQMNGIANASTDAVQLQAVEIPPCQIPQSPSRPIHPNPSLLNGPSLSPQGQAIGPPGIQRSEAAYGSPLAPAGSSSPTRPRHPSIHGGVNTNRFPASSPPRFQNNPASSFGNGTPESRPKGSPFNNSNPFQSNFHPTYANSFSRPTSAAGPAPFGSPVKHSSPRPSNGVPNGYNFTNSPHSSFPPSNVQASAMSPIKHSSPPPTLPQVSSPAPAPVTFAPSPSQMPARILPDPIPAPLKHDGARPSSSHELSEVHVFPPIKSLSPIVPHQNLIPPTKKSSPAPDRSHVTSLNGNSFGSS